jgi:hypothetical protein
VSEDIKGEANDGGSRYPTNIEQHVNDKNILRELIHECRMA